MTVLCAVEMYTVAGLLYCTTESITTGHSIYKYTVAIAISLLCNYFNMAAILQKHVVHFNYEHFVSIILNSGTTFGRK